MLIRMESTMTKCLWFSSAIILPSTCCVLDCYRTTIWTAVVTLLPWMKLFVCQMTEVANVKIIVHRYYM